MAKRVLVSFQCDLDALGVLNEEVVYAHANTLEARYCSMDVLENIVEYYNEKHICMCTSMDIKELK